MREMTDQEINEVGGGFVGTPIPFTNGFIPGPNWPGGASGAWLAMPVAFGTGWKMGQHLNNMVKDTFGMSTGEALHKTLDS